MKYKILEAESGPELEKMVEDYLTRGWKPQGGLQVLRYHVGPEERMRWVWLQAMYREDTSGRPNANKMNP